MVSDKLTVNEIDAFNEFKDILDIRGKKVLEIGGCLIKKKNLIEDVMEWHSVDPLNKNECFDSRYYSYSCDSKELPFEDNYFDFIFSSNAFHHVHDLRIVFNELYRVLKKEGVLYSSFGPIWSAPDGSHIENLKFGEKVYNFWEEQLIPDFYHLVYTKQELNSILNNHFSKAKSKVIVNYVFQSSWINRLPLDDYMDILKNSRFKVIDMKKIKSRGYDIKSMNINNPYEKKFSSWLKNKQVDLDLETRDLKLLLMK